MLLIPAILSYHEQGRCIHGEGVHADAACYCCCFRNFIRLFSVFLISKYFAVCITRGISSIAPHMKWWHFIIPTPGAFIVLCTEHVCIHTGPLVLLFAIFSLSTFGKEALGFHSRCRARFTRQLDSRDTEWERASERAHPASFKQYTLKPIDVVNIKVCWR